MKERTFSKQLKFASGRSRRLYCSQSGGILPLFVILLVPLVFLIAFSVDTGVFLSHDDEWQRVADAAAVAALGVYLDELRQAGNPAKPTAVEVKNAAVEAHERATHLLEANPLFAQQFLMDPSVKPTLIGLDSDGKFGRLEFGIFCSRAEVDAGKTNCDETGFNRQPYDFVAAGLDPNNSIRINLNMNEGSNTLTSFFSKVMGFETQDFDMEAVSVFSPVSIMVLLDASKSVWEQTHRPIGRYYPAQYLAADGNPVGDCTAANLASDFERAALPACSYRGTRTDAALRLKDAVGCQYEFEPAQAVCARAGSAGYNCLSGCVTAGPGCPRPSPMHGSHDAAEWFTYPVQLPSNYTDPFSGDADGFDDLRHPMEHYYCRTFPNGQSYLVDYGTDYADSVDDFVASWEPWDSLRAGVVAVMDEIEERLSAQDLFGALAVDESPLDPTRGLALSNPSASQFAQFKVGIGENPLLWSPGIEPVAYGWVPLWNAYTDFAWRTVEAVTMLVNQSSHPYTELSILAYTDGLWNCHFDGMGARVCNTDGRSIIKGLEEEVPILADWLAMNEISFSVAAAGPRFRELVYRSALATGCMGFPEMAELGVPPFNSNWDARYNPNTVVNWATNADSDFYADYAFEQDPSNPNSWPQPFYAPLEIYDRVVARTNGVFKAIPPCFRNPGGDCVGFCTELWNYCDNTGSPGDLMVNAVVDIPGIGPTQVTDAQGRGLYNCDGVDMKDGIKEALKSLVNLRVFNSLADPYPDGPLSSLIP